MRVRIVLVEPREAGNVGAAARAMKNFGFTDLWIAGSGAERTDDVSSWWAVGANDVVLAATRTATLGEALADCHLTVATTAVRERHVLEQLTPAEVAELARETLGEEHRLALVFGRERWGLSGSEIALCQRTASIPTWPEFPTMNLAQSVAIFCYVPGNRGMSAHQAGRDRAFCRRNAITLSRKKPPTMPTSQRNSSRRD